MPSHELQSVKKIVTYSSELTNPFKLFVVTGDVFTKIIPVFNGDLSVPDAIIKVGTQNLSTTLLTMDGDKDDYRLDFNRLLSDYPISSDIYHSVNKPIGSGTITFYCVYAPLSEDGLVEGAE